MFHSLSKTFVRSILLSVLACSDVTWQEIGHMCGSVAKTGTQIEHASSEEGF